MEPQLKILHIEDNSADAGLIQRELKKGGFDAIIKVVESREEFINGLNNFIPDLILSDHSLPQFDSMEALQIYKQNNLTIPFILITGSVSEEFAIKSIKEGADDYILKNNLVRLPSAIKQALKSRQIEQDKRRANLLLEATNKELNTFIYKAAHDLRGPLCSIMGLTRIAGMEKEKNNLPDYIQKISDSTEKLDAVLLSLIDVMSIKDSKPMIRQIDFKNMIDAILLRFTFLDGYNELAFKIKIESKRKYFSDEHILNSILQNTIENAIKYRNVSKVNSYVAITISNINDFVKIEVEDNGVGMENEVQEQIFEMYFRGNQGSKGSGLGLYIVQNGVRKLGGTIEVESEITKGSKFTILLPAPSFHAQ
ncbi:MAG: HAMP domain-containing sensor histidine kinase [Bacteroidia bacterium]